MNISLKVSFQLVGILIATMVVPGCGPASGFGRVKVKCSVYSGEYALMTPPNEPEAYEECGFIQNFAIMDVRVSQPVDYTVLRVESHNPLSGSPVGCVHFEHDRETIEVNPYSSANNCDLPNLTHLSPPSPVVSVSIGENAASNTCGTVDEGQTLTLQCPLGLVMRDVVFADYGLPFGACGSFSFNPFCHDAPVAAEVVRLVCAGKSTCTINANNGTFSDPCVGTPKHLSAEMTCSQ